MAQRSVCDFCFRFRNPYETDEEQTDGRARPVTRLKQPHNYRPKWILFSAQRYCNKMFLSLKAMSERFSWFWQNANCQYSLIFWLLMHLNRPTLKIRYKVLTFLFSRLRQFSKLWRHMQEGC